MIKTHSLTWPLCAFAVLLLSAPSPGAAQLPPAQLKSTPSITLGEARALVEGAVAFARARNFRMSVVVLDDTGEIVSADRMDGASSIDTHFAEGKAYAALMLRQTTGTLAGLAKTRPDRFFGILNTYPGKVYLVDGGEPLGVNGNLVGAVGVAGLPQGMDEAAGAAGIAAFEKLHAERK